MLSAKRYGVDTTDDWIVQRTGIEERRFAPEGTATSDLAVPAVEMALQRAGLSKTDIGMIIFATLSPDHCFPGAGVYLQTKLGLTDADVGHFVGCLDVRNQCSGFLYGLATATSMVQSGSVDQRGGGGRRASLRGARPLIHRARRRLTVRRWCGGRDRERDRRRPRCSELASRCRRTSCGRALSESVGHKQAPLHSAQRRRRWPGRVRASCGPTCRGGSSSRTPSNA